MQALHFLHLEELLCQVCSGQILLDTLVHLFWLELISCHYKAAVQSLYHAIGTMYGNDVGTCMAG